MKIAGTDAREPCCSRTLEEVPLGWPIYTAGFAGRPNPITDCESFKSWAATAPNSGTLCLDIKCDGAPAVYFVGGDGVDDPYNPCPGGDCTGVETPVLVVPIYCEFYDYKQAITCAQKTEAQCLGGGVIEFTAGKNCGETLSSGCQCGLVEYWTNMWANIEGCLNMPTGGEPNTLEFCKTCVDRVQ